MTADPVPRRRWPFLLLRATTVVLAALALVQTALAGGFLAGHYDALKMHSMTGMTMGALAVAQAVAAVFLWRAGGPRAVLVGGLALPVLLAGQVLLGMTRVLIVHVPVGALLVAGILRMAAWVWRAPLPSRAVGAPA
ncbi:hypothetical protein FNH05_34160 [Amycolatopsis rhizosphaerae]|uniref:Uncharacterized protein n=1 Tax=Amycolatopsis rhizosphaerae TaxID=2053003 RepID=A0A558A9Z3_9PSEU|nr:hypothetical protein [Amycolatopsis rhizosphaerae]TVT21079.1 hypothetical protein FNH05_34160 [Amycolatopsis rhizosphaerae]